MFKKRNLQKKIDINKDVEQIELSLNPIDKKTLLEQNILSKKISKPDKDHEEKQLAKKTMRYGLIEKQVEAEQKPKQQNTLLNYYIKMRMEEINSKKEQQAVDTTASEILQMQKQYLSAAQSKITEYDVKEIQKKLEKLATQAIKNQMESRNKYLVDLLQNQHERMEYASKKELKVIKQERERMEKELSSKYASEGRRHYLEYLKQQNFKEMN